METMRVTVPDVPGRHRDREGSVAPVVAAGRARRWLLVAPYGWVVRWWLASRLVVLSAAVMGQLAGWRGAPAFGRRPLALLTGWDGRWYRAIADHGYLVVPGRENDTAFFPLYPLAMRGLHVLGLPLNVGGLLISNVAFLVALMALYELARTWLSEGVARRTVVYVALFPFGFVFSMVYPEALVLAAAALAGLLAVRGRWLPCALAVVCATLARPEGVFLALPVLALAARSWRHLDDSSRGRATVAVLAAPAALAALVLYEWRAVGDPVAFSHAQGAWGRSTRPDGIVHAVTTIIHLPPTLDRGWLYESAAFCLVYLVCLAFARRAGVPGSWVVAGMLIVLLPLSTGSFMSDARFGLLALPVYWGLAYVTRRRRLDTVLRVACVALLGTGSATVLFHWP